jgi:isoleucyl-tRNA synthetase
VTLEAGTGAVHTAGGHGPDDYTISQNTVWKSLTRLARTAPAGYLSALDGNVFKANDIIVDAA